MSVRVAKALTACDWRSQQLVKHRQTTEMTREHITFANVQVTLIP